MSPIVLVLAVCVFLFELRKWYLNSTKLKNFVELKGIPILGLGYKFIGKANEDLLQLYTKIFSQGSSTGSLRYTWMLGHLLFLIDDPSDLQVILNSDSCLQKPFLYRYVGPKNGLFIADKQTWKSHRRALNPTLSQKMVVSFISIFNEKFKITADQMEAFVGQNIDLHRPMFKASAEAILASQCGVNWPFQTSRGDEMYELLDEYFECIQWRVVRFWLRWDFIYRLTNMYKREWNAYKHIIRFAHSTEEVKRIELADKMQRGEDELENRKQSNSLNFIEKCLSLFREQVFSADDVNQELQTIFVGATDTSSTVLSATLLMLAIHQEYQDRVFAELREIFQNADDDITNEDVTKMKYLELVIKESIRLFPVGVILGNFFRFVHFRRQTSIDSSF